MSSPEQIIWDVAVHRAEFELKRLCLRKEAFGLRVEGLTYDYVVNSRALVARIRAAIAAEVAAELAKADAA